MESSEPSEKLLTLLEALAEFPEPGPTHAELREKTGLPAATLLRMLRTLEKRAYVLRDDQKRYGRRFRLERDLPWDERLVALARGELVSLMKRTGESAELLTVRGTDLYWYDKVEPELQAVRIVAKPGFRRTLRELDAPSRLALKCLGEAEVAAAFDHSAFYGILAAREALPWPEARRRIEETREGGVVFDERGNGNGVRRYAIAVRDRAGRLVFMYAVAEAAVPANDAADHRKAIHEALIQARKKIEGAWTAPGTPPAPRGRENGGSRGAPA